MFSKSWFPPALYVYIVVDIYIFKILNILGLLIQNNSKMGNTSV